MRRRHLSGEDWKSTIGEVAVIAPDLEKRYGDALDLLAKEAAPHILDCDGGIWTSRSADTGRHKLSLAWLGNLLVTECENARLAAAAVSPAPVNLRPPTAGRSRQKLVKDMRSVARALTKNPDISLDAIQAATKYVVSSPSVINSRFASVSAGMRWTQPLLTRSDLASALRAISDVMENLDRRSTTRRSEMPETSLARILVTELRVATGAPGSYQNGGPIPRGGKPLYDVVTAFLNAAGWSMDVGTIKSRIEAKPRATGA
jgi:hypothetical protein